MSWYEGRITQGRTCWDVMNARVTCCAPAELQGRLSSTPVILSTGSPVVNSSSAFLPWKSNTGVSSISPECFFCTLDLFPLFTCVTEKRWLSSHDNNQWCKTVSTISFSHSFHHFGFSCSFCCSASWEDLAESTFSELWYPDLLTVSKLTLSPKGRFWQLSFKRVRYLRSKELDFSTQKNGEVCISDGEVVRLCAFEESLKGLRYVALSWVSSGTLCGDLQAFWAQLSPLPVTVEGSWVTALDWAALLELKAQRSFCCLCCRSSAYEEIQ